MKVREENILFVMFPIWWGLVWINERTLGPCHHYVPCKKSEDNQGLLSHCRQRRWKEWRGLAVVFKVHRSLESWERCHFSGNGEDLVIKMIDVRQFHHRRTYSEAQKYKRNTIVSDHCFADMNVLFIVGLEVCSEEVWRDNIFDSLPTMRVDQNSPYIFLQTFLHSGKHFIWCRQSLLLAILWKLKCLSPGSW